MSNQMHQLGQIRETDRRGAFAQGAQKLPTMTRPWRVVRRIPNKSSSQSVAGYSGPFRGLVLMFISNTCQA